VSCDKVSEGKNRDRGDSYAAVLELALEDMQSSHGIKRFLRKFRGVVSKVYRRVVREVFVWRLNKERPGIMGEGDSALYCFSFFGLPGFKHSSER